MSEEKDGWFKSKFGKKKQTQPDPDALWTEALQSLDTVLVKVKEAIDLLEEVDDDGADDESTKLVGWKKERDDIENMSLNRIYISDATEQAGILTTRLRDEFTRIRKLAKNTPYGQTVKVGNKDVDVKVFGPDIPGFYEAQSKKDRDALVLEAAKKIARGTAKIGEIKQGAAGKASPTDVTDVMWALKTIGQKKLGKAWDKGAMSVADDDGAILDFFDTCGEELYLRGSSHFYEQQIQKGQQSRGMDFYGGTEGGEGTSVNDFDSLLPTGMNTMTYQRMTLPNDEKVIYLKMETAGVYNSSPAGKKDKDAPKTRKSRKGDFGHSLQHTFNFLAAHESDPELANFREDVPDALNVQMKAILAAVKDNKPAANRIKASMGIKVGAVKNKPCFRINTFLAALSDLVNDDNMDLGDPAYDLILPFLDDIERMFPDGDAMRRGGGEVVLTASDLS